MLRPGETRETYRVLVEQLGGVAPVSKALGIPYATLWDRVQPENKPGSKKRAGKLTHEMFLALKQLTGPVPVLSQTLTREAVYQLIAESGLVNFAAIESRIVLAQFDYTKRGLYQALTRLKDDGLIESPSRGIYRAIPKKVCRVEECRNKSRARGLCMKHYQMYRDGGLLHEFPREDETPAEQPGPECSASDSAPLPDIQRAASGGRQPYAQPSDE